MVKHASLVEHGNFATEQYFENCFVVFFVLAKGFGSSPFFIKIYARVSSVTTGLWMLHEYVV